MNEKILEFKNLNLMLKPNDVIDITRYSKAKVYRLFKDDESFKSFRHNGCWRIKLVDFKDWLSSLSKTA